MKNYIDEKGNYNNVENKTLKEIFDDGYEDGYHDGIIAAGPKKAKWTKISPAGIYECSNCKGDVMPMTGEITLYRFCHKCGAYMQ